ncbi:MAG: zinc-ribbon domain-containing protein [Clostridiales Family XIII bacterium]|jgi:ribosomal protein L40E|nr:zinc-ribbon domain-containing protein [Clostridiales Family XIII bacterium]
MAFFNELGKKISETGQTVVQKTKDTTESMRINGLISEEEQKIDQVYQQIGKAYYEGFRQSADPKFEEPMAWIDHAKERIAGYKEQLNLLKGLEICPTCNAAVPADATFCSACGSKMPPKQPQAAAGGQPAGETKFCAQCGAQISKAATFCNHCGAKQA